MHTRLMPFILLALSAVAGCGLDYEDAARHRLEYARLGLGNIVVAAIAEPESASYINGIKLAARQLNGQPGKLLGRRVSLLLEPATGATFDDSRSAILKLAENPRVSAVLGHRRAELAIPSAAIYEASELIFMPPFATAQGLTDLNYRYVFRMLPNNQVMAGQIASVAALLGHKNIVLLYAEDEYSRELAFLFEEAAIAQGMGLVQRHSFKPNGTDYRELIAQFANQPMDMVFLSAGAVDSAQMVRHLRDMGVKVAIMGGEALNTHSFSEAVGAAGDNTIAPVSYSAQANNPANLAFIAEYQQLYGMVPDEGAAQGYDSMRLLADAIERAKSTVPALVSASLHYRPFWTGVTGPYAFDRQGEVSGKMYFFRVLRGGAWHFLPAVHRPYALERFDRRIGSQPNRKTPVTDFAKAFSANLHPDDLRILQLDFSHELLRFQHLGVVYGGQDAATIPGGVERVMALGEQRGFRVITCGVDFSVQDQQPLERQVLDCYGKLADNVDVLIITGFEGVDKDIAVRLQRPLKDYKIPVLALQGDTGFDEGLSIRIGGFGEKRNIQADFNTDLFGGILYRVKPHELAEKLDNMPVLRGNLNVLDDYRLLRSGNQAGLVPDIELE